MFSVLLIFWLLHYVATRKHVQPQYSNLAILMFFESKQYLKKTTKQNIVVMEDI